VTSTPDEPLPEQPDDQGEDDQQDHVGEGAPKGDDEVYRSGERYSGTEN
jgi:hypothetical protein